MELGESHDVTIFLEILGYCGNIYGINYMRARKLQWYVSFALMAFNVANEAFLYKT